MKIAVYLILIACLAGLANVVVGCNTPYNTEALRPNRISSSTPQSQIEREPPPISLEMLYPAGVSPKVFAMGWVFGAKCWLNPGTKDQEDISDRVRWVGEAVFYPPEGSITRPVFTKIGENVIFLEVRVGQDIVRQQYTITTISPAGYAHIGDKCFCPADSHGCPACPHPVTGTILTGSPNVEIDRLPAARVGDTGTHSACCGSNTFEIVSGDPNVLIDGRPAGRLGDKTQHCGGVGYIGVPPSTIPAPTTTTKTIAPPSTTAPPNTQAVSQLIVTDIKGSVSVEDYGQQVATVYISGGKAPYYYEWIGSESLYSGSSSGTSHQIAFKKSQFSFDGQVYSVRVSVKDSTGQYASWKSADGSTKTKFALCYKYDPGKKDASGKWIVQPHWMVFTEPKFP